MTSNPISVRRTKNGWDLIKIDISNDIIAPEGRKEGLMG